MGTASDANPAFDLIGLTQLRNDSKFDGIDGSGFTVAVIDTGLDRTHPLLQPNYVTGLDLVNGGTNPIDTLRHGTHVAGTIGATDEEIGVATDVGLIGLQVFGSTGLTYNPTVEQALQWVLDNHEQYNIVAVNLSLGGGSYQTKNQVSGDILSDDIKQLEEAGITVVAAAGNSYKGNEYQNVAAPAIYSTLAVGAVWQDDEYSGYWWGNGAVDYSTQADQIASISQRLDSPNMIFAPGALITSTVPGGKLEQYGGTSMAAPIVTGTVALMQEAAMEFGGRLLSPAEIVDILQSTADTIYDGDDEDDNVTNTNISYPRLNVYNAISEIASRFQGKIAEDPGDNTPVPVTTDPNGSIASSVVGSNLDGSAVPSIIGTIGADGSSIVGNKDVDLIRFQVTAPGVVTLELSTHTKTPQDFNTLLRLFNQSGTELTFDDDSGAGSFSKISTYLNAGTYYVGVSGFGNRNYNPNTAGSGSAGETGTFSLNFSLNSSDPNGVITGAVAVNLGTSQSPLTFSGEIGRDTTQGVFNPADVDLFKVVAPDSGFLYVDIDTPFSTGYVDSFLKIFDSTGALLNGAESDNHLAIDQSGAFTEFTQTGSPGTVFSSSSGGTIVGHTSDSFLKLAVERGETYYIGVSDTDNSEYSATSLNDRSTTGTGGQYKLVVNFNNTDLNGSISSTLPTLSLTSAPQLESIGSDRTQTGQTQAVGDRDVDFFKVRPTTSGILEIDVDSMVDKSISDRVDTHLLVFDASGNLIGANDDNFADDSGKISGYLDPLLRVQVQANTDYYVAIAGYGNSNFDPYAAGSGSSGDTGDYRIQGRVLSLSEVPLFSDNSINNGTPQDMSVGSLMLGNIGRDSSFIVGASDVDLYRFEAESTGEVEIQVAAAALGADTVAIVDSFLRIFDATGKEIAYNDDASSTTTGSLLKLSVTEGQTYFIGVNGSSSQARNYNALTGTGAAVGSQGNYQLSITDNNTSIDPPGTSTDGDDVINGSENDDKISGLNGNDSIFGKGGNDILKGDRGDDELIGEEGNDILRGSGGDDVIKGGNGNDNLSGGSDNDVLDGGIGKDTLRGSAGNDILKGDKSKDKLMGKQGDDILIGGSSRNKLKGASGRDTFVLETIGVQIIRDFEVEDDWLELRGSIGFNDLLITQNGNKTAIAVDGKEIALLANVDASDITKNAFVN